MKQKTPHIFLKNPEPIYKIRLINRKDKDNLRRFIIGLDLLLGIRAEGIDPVRIRKMTF